MQVSKVRNMPARASEIKRLQDVVSRPRGVDTSPQATNLASIKSKMQRIRTANDKNNNVKAQNATRQNRVRPVTVDYKEPEALLTQARPALAKIAAEQPVQQQNYPNKQVAIDTNDVRVQIKRREQSVNNIIKTNHDNIQQNKNARLDLARAQNVRASELASKPAELQRLQGSSPPTTLQDVRNVFASDTPAQDFDILKPPLTKKGDADDIFAVTRQQEIHLKNKSKATSLKKGVVQEIDREKQLNQLANEYLNESQTDVTDLAAAATKFEGNALKSSFQRSLLQQNVPISNKAETSLATSARQHNEQLMNNVERVMSSSTNIRPVELDSATQDQIQALQRDIDNIRKEKDAIAASNRDITLQNEEYKTKLQRTFTELKNDALKAARAKRVALQRQLDESEDADVRHNTQTELERIDAEIDEIQLPMTHKSDKIKMQHWLTESQTRNNQLLTETDLLKSELAAREMSNTQLQKQLRAVEEDVSKFEDMKDESVRQMQKTHSDTIKKMADDMKTLSDKQHESGVEVAKLEMELAQSRQERESLTSANTALKKRISADEAKKETLDRLSQRDKIERDAMQSDFSAREQKLQVALQRQQTVASTMRESLDEEQARVAKLQKQMEKERNTYKKLKTSTSNAQALERQSKQLQIDLASQNGWSVGQN